MESNENLQEIAPLRAKGFAVIPTLLTLGNAVCGFGAITLIALVGPEDIETNVKSAKTASELLFVAAELIFLAMVFDTLDGSVARLTKQTSDFGAQLDSLCDVVSFGVAPAFLMLKLMHPDHELLKVIVRAPFEFPPRMLWTIAVLYMICAILRLARFTVEIGDKESRDYFSGLPSPAAAGVIAAFPIALLSLRDLAAENSLSVSFSFVRLLLHPLIVILPLITILVSLLMVSRIRYPNPSSRIFRETGNRKTLLFVVVAALLIFSMRELALPILFCFFAFASPTAALIRWRASRRDKLRTPPQHNSTNEP